MLKDLLGFMLAYALKARRRKRAASLCAQANRLWENGDTAGAESLLRKAIASDPGSAQVAGNLGLLVFERGNREEGMALLQKAVALDPQFAGARVNYAIALYLGGASEEALTQYRVALGIDPDNAEARLNMLMPLLETCDWDSSEAEVARLIERAADPADAKILDCVDPFLSLVVPIPPALRLRIARHHSKIAASRVARLPRVQRVDRGRERTKLRIGYVSNSFQNGATAHLASGLFEQHDRARFETFAYSLRTDGDDGGGYRARLVAAFDHFHDIRSLDHRGAAQRIADDGIDILVDIMGFQADARPEIGEMRPAPVQVSFLGYPGTLGSEAFDYLVADRTVIPESEVQYYAEKIIWMPDAYQANDDLQPIAAPTDRAENRLPAAGFVFCGFNQQSKIERHVIDRWLRILGHVPGSVLWLLAGPGEGRLRARAAQQGIDPARLVFGPLLPKADHLSRLRLVDLFLDTYTYNAHTTSSDALWAGVPVLTCPSPSFAGRVASSLLKAVGLPELICTDLAEYERQAVALALDPSGLAALRAKLAANRLTHPLFDTRKYTRHFEHALDTIWEIHRAGGVHRSFAVDTLPKPRD